MRTWTCAWCGKKGTSYNDRVIPEGWLGTKTALFFVRPFCSLACKRAWEQDHAERESNSNSNSNSNNSYSDYSNDHVNSESAEEIIAKAQADRIRRETTMKEEEHEKETRKQRVKELKAEGRPFLAFCVEFQNTLLWGAVVLFNVILLLFALCRK